MEKIITIQQKEKLNEVYAIDEKGNGGANHLYCIEADNIQKVNRKPAFRQEIQFQNGARNVDGSIQGVLDVDLLEIVKHRLECFQEGPYSSEYNERALHHITEALKWMNKRIEDRIARNVLGTNNK